MVLDVVLAFGLLLSLATQLRLSIVPIGPGELCLALWLLLSAIRLVLGPGLTPSPVLAKLTTFWSVFAVAMCIGTMTAIVIGDIHDPPWFWHDLVSYAFVAALSILIIADGRAIERLGRVSSLLAVFGTAFLLLQIAAALDVIDVAGIDPWEWDRMRGFTQNANQLAMFCLVLGLIGLHLLENAHHRAKQLFGFAALVTSFITGRLTKSDAFLLAAVVTAPLYMAHRSRRWLEVRTRQVGVLLLFLLLPSIAIPALLLVVTSDAEPGQQMEELAIASSREGNDVSAKLRFQIWGSAIDRALDSGLLGLGPGPHLPVPRAIALGRKESTTEEENVVHPALGAVPNFEAHNTALDLLVQGGVIVLLATCWLGLVAAGMTLRARTDALSTLLCGLAVYSLFHFTFRQPMTWFVVVFCWMTAYSRIANPWEEQTWKVRAGRVAFI
jgi:O-antigen ligase/polysaccharide polymerase Wzy-like membrane protein